MVFLPLKPSEYARIGQESSQASDALDHILSNLWKNTLRIIELPTIYLTSSLYAITYVVPNKVANLRIPSSERLLSGRSGCQTGRVCGQICPKALLMPTLRINWWLDVGT